MFAAKHFDKYKIVFADIVEHVKQAGSNCNLGKPHLNPNQIKTKESLAQNIKDKTHKVESIMYGEFHSWKRNNNPLLRAKDIFRRHPQKKHPQSNLSLSYSLDDLQLSCWKSGKRNLT